MNTRPVLRVFRTILAVLLTAALIAGPPSPPRAEAETMRHRMLEKINHARALRDLRPLRLNFRLSKDAKRHTLRMVRKRKIYHSERIMEFLRPFDWRSWGENVGCANTLRHLHRSFMHSSAHRSNILRAGFRRVGLGVLRIDRRSFCGRRHSVWTTEIFFG